MELNNYFLILLNTTKLPIYDRSTLIVEVAVESILHVETDIFVRCSAVAVFMNAWKCFCLDSWALRKMRMVENGIFIKNYYNRCRFIYLVSCVDSKIFEFK